MEVSTPRLLATFVGPPDPLPHGGGTLRITSVDVFDDGVRVRILFWVPDDAPFPSQQYEAHRADMLARLPHIDVEEIDGLIEARWLGDLLGDCVVAKDAVAPQGSLRRVQRSSDSGHWGLRTIVRTIHLPMTPVPRHLTMTWGEATLHLDLPPVEPIDA